MNPPAVPKKGSRIVIWLVLVGVALLPTLFIIWRLSMASKVRSQLAALRQAGHPLTPAELEKKYYSDVDASNNVAPFYLEAFAKLRISNAPEREIQAIVSPTNGPIPTITIAELRQFNELLMSNRDALQLLEQKPSATNCRYPIDFSRGMLTLLPHLQKLKSAAQLLQLDAIVHSEQHETAAALADFDAALRLTATLDHEPIMISRLVQITAQTSPSIL